MFFKNRIKLLNPKIHLKKFLRVYKAPLLSGFLFGVSFIPFPFFTLFFALVPLWLFMCRQSHLKKMLLGCFLCQFISTFIGFNWMIYTFHNFGGISWFFSFILLLGFCCIANLYVLISSVLWFFLVKKFSPPIVVKLILLPIIFSFFHSIIPTVFPWNMGYPWLWGGLPGAQTAELWGFRFLDTLFYVFNLLFLIAYNHLDFEKKQETEARGIKKYLRHMINFRLDSFGKKALAGAFILFISLNALGFYLKTRLAEPDTFLNVILVQNNIGSVAFMDPRPFYSKEKKALYISKTLTYKSLKSVRQEARAEDIDFILWSEGAYAYPINKNFSKEPRLSKMVRALKIPLITGALSKNNKRRGNSLVLFDRKGNIVKPIYDKVKLLIFGEYFPGIDRFPFLRKLFPYFGSNFTPGKAFQVQKLEGRFLGWQICYEALFDKISRDLAKKKAQILVNITNDSWYGSWQEPYQHLTMSLARAIEVRRPLIRATNTGYSGVIYANGEIDKLSPLNKAWFHLYKVPYYKEPPQTLFMSWGYYIHEIFLFFLVLFSGFAWAFRLSFF